MAKVESLGTHSPVALPYLIREAILPPDPKKELYQWETYVCDDGPGEVEEELLVTKNCVVWSQGRSARNVYRFELEGEAVSQAILTQFPAPSPSNNHEAKSVLEGYAKVRTNRQSLGPALTATSDAPTSTPSGHESSSRALVVFLKTKAHIHYLNGSKHIINLPFEIERAFPALRGCVLLRKPASAPAAPPTPQMPSAPPNSFFFSQSQASASFLQSPTLARSFGRSQPAKPSPLGGGGRLDALFQDLLASPASGMSGDEVASLYSLTSPLADLGVLTYSLQHQKPRMLNRAQAGLSVEFESLDSAERVVYVSPRDELGGQQTQKAGDLILLVTINEDLHTLTIWHAWYVDEKPLKELLKQRAVHKAAKARRRSSFMSAANVGTGATTPGVRTREHTRESFAGAGSLRLPGEPAHPAQQVSRKTTRQEEEEAMASQMDPDYQPAATSQQPARENRRISSLNMDTRTSQTAAGASFAGAGGARRNTSFGGANDRRSFGRRKSRGSTPGSTVLGRSLGAEDDDLMDLDNEDGDAGEESVEGVVRHIRATFEAAGADSVFGSIDEDFRRELVVRKLHSLPVTRRSQHAPTAASFKVATLKDAQPSFGSDDRTLGLYLCDQTTREVTYLKVLVKRRPLWPDGGAEQSTIHVVVPIVLEHKALEKAADLIKLRDGRVEAILLSGRGLVLRNSGSNVCLLPDPNASYRVYSPFDMPLPYSGPANAEVGKNRTLRVSQDALSYAHSGVRSTFDEVDAEGTHHRRRLQFRPDDPHIDHLLEVCHIVLPEATVPARQMWCLCFARLQVNTGDSSGTGSSVEWLAFAATVLFYGVGLLDGKARAALNLSRVAAARQKSGAHGAYRLQKQRQEGGMLSKPAWSWMSEESTTSVEPALTSPNTRSQLDRRKDQLLPLAAGLADDLWHFFPMGGPATGLAPSTYAVRLMLALHVAREEQKLSTLSAPRSRESNLSPIIAQLGHWLGPPAWSFASGSYYDLEGAGEEWVFVKSTPSRSAEVHLMEEPIGVFQWFEQALTVHSTQKYPTLATIAELDAANAPSASFTNAAHALTPRLYALSSLLAATAGLTAGPVATVELMAKHGLDNDMLETLPQAIAAPFKDAISHCERDPPTTWQDTLLKLVGREDALPDSGGKARTMPSAHSNGTAAPASHDVQAVCHALEQHSHALKTREAARHSVSQLIFSQDRRLLEAMGLMRYYSTQEAECAKQPDWSDAHHFDQQRRVIDSVTMRMWALPAGDGMLHYDCLTPLLTEKYTPYGFGSRCLMQPMGITLNIDRSAMSEEKVGWAYFHAGVSSGLRISKHVKGIDTSWVAFNKPSELTNRHAGLLLALGLGGHLRSLAKWLSFKYLTPKHTMTSIGLLLGLSASYIGTMDSLITRMLSIHITRLLPPGAAELNVSPIAQTAGLMGIGLLYFHTQHRRMSEIMLSEIEYLEVEDPDSGPDPLRDESYRLAAGFALGLINLGKGRDLRGLHGMHLPERLLAVAVGSRPVHAVHVFDRATAGAIIAVTLIYMKSGDEAIAGKVDIPDTEAQFDHVRPDMLLLRAMAAHVITWHDIKVHPNKSWIEDNLPACYKGLLRALSSAKTKHPLQTADVPFYNIITGLAWAIGLKYAGSGHEIARKDILRVLDMFYTIGGESYYYDAKLARATVRRCIDVLALAAATVMAGTGDLITFRYLRRLHGRTDAETPYGSHMAAHLALGVLFMGGGTYTFGTSDFALASLICAFYPLFPADVHDNRVHLQAFRHFWVFAAEARCLVVDDIDTHRSIKTPITVTLRDGGVRKLHAPCLLPELDTIAKVTTEDPAYWRLTLDFARNPQHLKAFRENQTVFVRRCPAGEAHQSVFSSALAALNDAQISPVAGRGDLWQSVFGLSALRGLEKADVELVLSPDVYSSVNVDERVTVVDDRLVLGNAAAAAATIGSAGRDRLWNLRVLLAWAERAREDGEGEVRWLGSAVLDGLRARVEERIRVVAEGE